MDLIFFLYGNQLVIIRKVSGCNVNKTQQFLSLAYV